MPPVGLAEPSNSSEKPPIPSDGSALSDALSSNSAKNAPDLVNLLSRWESLTPEVRAAILALVHPEGNQVSGE